MFNTLNISFYSFCHYKTTRSVFLPTVIDFSLAFRMTSCRSVSFSTFSCQLPADS